MSRALKRWQQYFKAVPQDAVVTECDCRSMKKLLSNCPEKVDYYEWWDIFDTINEFVDANPTRIGITEEHHRKGQEWIRKSISMIRRHFKDRPYPRDLFEQAASEGVKAFYFAGFMDCTDTYTRNHYGDRRVIVPIWRVELPSGKQFRYAYASWQSNLGIEFDPEHVV